jgi:hypothetical protein
MVHRNINGAMQYHDPVINLRIERFAGGIGTKPP